MAKKNKKVTSKKASGKAKAKKKPSKKKASTTEVKKKTVKKKPSRAKRPRDIEKIYSVSQFAEKLRRFADSLETGKQFRIQIANHRILVPVGATFSVEHERGKDEEEVEFQLKWPLS